MTRGRVPAERVTLSPSSRLADIVHGRGRAILLIVLVGLFVRLLLAPHFNVKDFAFFIVPWVRFIDEHHTGSLRYAFTDYSPLYSYLLLIARACLPAAPALVLVKVISLVFELGCAVAGATIVAVCVGKDRPARPIVAFAAIWLAPSLLYNGPAWGQADSIWTCFILLAILQFVRGREVSGVAAFGAAFAMKAQSAFLGPFVLGFLARGSVWRALWLGLVPLIYLTVAIPVLLAGRPFTEVALIYGNQAGKYHYLTSNAASIWSLVPGFPYELGSLIGLAVGAGLALAVAWLIARSPRRDPEFMLLAAAASLLLLPFVLPMMHDRYFYAYEITAIVLACVKPRYLPFAAIAQVNCLLAYVSYDLQIKYGVRIAAISNAVAIYFLLRSLLCQGETAPFPRIEWVNYGLAVAATGLFLALAGAGEPSVAFKLGSTVLLGGALAYTGYRLLARSLGGVSLARPQPN